MSEHEQNREAVGPRLDRRVGRLVNGEDDMNTQDKELTEKAAQAAGINVEWLTGWRGPVIGRGMAARCWLPLEDDGDALRLAVQLGIGVDHEAMRSWAWRSWGTPTVLAQEEFHTHGKDAATRRAIVRAAAVMADSKTPNARLSG